ncbi:hypothetical protein C1Y63_09825 [Corynebacterium sp. 13CS0277]|uniref:hypothetical protein n=1 Tax=Corynebacterium sp. 13CS0277 TaxID=2071994 RepID=UPI000D026968|nr:hypothetical protein [Corynebacterium sp. 13CS0277]PRQ10748.1 hypothetical protein C1Y63_09825 [Corynebacterium sp. 13CS0277]
MDNNQVSFFDIDGPAWVYVVKVPEPRDPNYPPAVFAVAFFEEDKWCTFLPTGGALPSLTTAGASPVPWPEERFTQWCDGRVCEVIDSVWVADATELWKAHAYLADGEILCMMGVPGDVWGLRRDYSVIRDRWIGDVTPEMVESWACPSVDNYEAEREAMWARMAEFPELKELKHQCLSRESFYIYDVLGVRWEKPHWPVRRWRGYRARRFTPPPNYPELYPDLRRNVPVDSFTYTPFS